MIVTLTPNPAVDQTVFVRGLEIGAVNRFRESHLDPAGKGINASRMAERLGWPSIAFGFLAGEIGLIAQRALEQEGIHHHFVQVPGQTRLNVTIVDEVGGTSTSFFGPGPAVDREHLARLDDLLRVWLKVSRVLVLAGSLPPGIPQDIYASYVHLARSSDIRSVLDADDEPLRLGVEARPYLVKPNVAEAERLLGRPLPNLAAVIEGATEIARRGVAVVVVSMGAQGAICVEGERVWRAIPPTVERRSTVGSGDSMVAGLSVALARGEPITEGLRLGTAAGAATAMIPGTTLGTPEDVEALLPQVRIEKIR